MEKVSIVELNKMKNELVELEENIGKFKDEVEELKKNDLVKGYIDADHEYQKSLSRIKFLKSEIPYQKMLNCDCYYWPKHGYYSYDEIPELKQIYDKFVDEYPQATDKDIENHIALVKKMKEGKSC